MIVFIEPISNNIGMYVPAYPLPLLEIASFVTAHLPQADISIISVPMDYGLPLTREGKQKIYGELIADLRRLKPKAVGISCTAISQFEETVELCTRIKACDPDIFIFIGGYLPTIYPKEFFQRTSAVDMLVVGEGEMAALGIARSLKNGESPKKESIPNLAWKQGANIHFTRKGRQFDLNEKVMLNMALLKTSNAYNILPYAFSRGCPYRCRFCMEEVIRPQRQSVPFEIVRSDLKNLLQNSSTRNLLAADALFNSFDLFPFLKSLRVKLNFETRCDVLNPEILPDIADVCGSLALGMESASYDTLRRMNKVKSRMHYEKYIANAKAIFKKASECDIPMMVFLIAGYPGETARDLDETYQFARDMAEYSGAGGHLFKVGECRVYPKTPLYDMACSMADVVFDNDGAFGQNVVRQPSKGLTFAAVSEHMQDTFSLSNITKKTLNSLHNMIPFFRFPSVAITDGIVPQECFKDNSRHIFITHRDSLAAFRAAAPALMQKYKKNMSGERSLRRLML